VVVGEMDTVQGKERGGRIKRLGGKPFEEEGGGVESLNPKGGMERHLK
jgi:hypothetical protein